MPLSVIISCYTRIIRISLQAGKNAGKAKNGTGVKAKASTRDQKVTRKTIWKIES